MTERLREAMLLMSRAEDSKFTLFLEGVLTGMERTGPIFTTSELTRLEGILGLSAHELNIVVQACAYLFEQAARQRSTGFSQVLQNAGLQQKKADCFGRVWEENGAHLIAHLREKPVSERTWLLSFEWKSLLPLGSPQLPPSKPSSSLRLQLNDSTVNLAFTRDELHRFFMDLEVIQTQLDSLSTT